jgi:hypothetical protein
MSKRPARARVRSNAELTAAVSEVMGRDLEEKILPLMATTREMSLSELSQFGWGKVAFIRTRTLEEAKQMFPNITGLPEEGALYSLHSADGVALAVTDTRTAAVGHAIGDDLEVIRVH